MKMKIRIGKEHRAAIFVIVAQLLALVAAATFIHVHDRAGGTTRFEAFEGNLQVASNPPVR
jgi:hypothetical protein